jgi:hypothetical protein
MKNIYICGDSYGTSDPEYGQCWVDLLPKLLNCNVINLSKVCASNLQIGLQIDYAIKHRADYIIYLITTSTRFDVGYAKTQHTELLDRYVDIKTKLPGHSLTSYSLNSLDDTTIFNKSQLALLQTYHAEFSDLNLLIYQSEILISGILSRLVNSKIKFCYDQGGFENINFDNITSKIYFEEYSKHKSAINLWNFGGATRHRPYFHITNNAVHNNVATYYANRIATELNI